MEVIDYTNLSGLDSDKETINKLLELLNTYNIVRNSSKGTKFIVKTKVENIVFKFLAKIAYNTNCHKCPLNLKLCWVSMDLDWESYLGIYDQINNVLCSFKTLDSLEYKTTEEEPRFKEELE